MFELIEAWLLAAGQIAEALPNWYWLGVCALLGLLVGSFLNVVILRLPASLEHEWNTIAAEMLQAELPESFSLGTAPASLVMERSCCPNCGLQLKWYHNIPLFSYLALRGRCAGCKQRISWQYPLVEALTMGLSILCYLRFGPSLACVAALIVTWLLVAMSGIDFRTQLLPDELTLPLLWFALLISTWPIFASSGEAIWGAALGWASLATVNWCFRKLKGVEGMGGGDFKLLAGLGALSGAPSLPFIVLISALPGALVAGVLMLLGKHKRETPLPFGPYLAFAGWLHMLYGEQLQRHYWQWFELL